MYADKEDEREYQRQYYLRNKEKHNARTRANYYANIDRYKAYAKEYKARKRAEKEGELREIRDSVVQRGDKSPEMGERVLIWAGNKFVGEGYKAFNAASGTAWYRYGLPVTDIFGSIEVSHWAPLPKAPGIEEVVADGHDNGLE